MDQATLVEQKQAEGRRIVQALDDSKLDPSAAFWFYYPDADQWRLIIAGPAFGKGKDPTDDYRKVAEAITKASPPVQTLSISDVRVLDETDPLVRALGSFVRTGKQLNEIRFTNNVINGIHVADALIYRLS